LSHLLKSKENENCSYGRSFNDEDIISDSLEHLISQKVT